jgi:hypothetical protein
MRFADLIENKNINSEDIEALKFISKKLLEKDWEWFKQNAINVKITDKYFILNYDQISSYSIGINKYNVLTRGTVFDRQGKLKSLPFKRFFNFGEKYAENIDFSNSEILQKLDGTLLAIFFDDNNKIVFHTRRLISSNKDDEDMQIKGFTSDGEFSIIKLAKKYIDKLNINNIYRDKVFIFELITSKNAVVTKYVENQFGLYLIGCRDINTLSEYSEDELDDLAKKINAKRPIRYSLDDKNYDAIKYMLNIGKEYSDDFEGFVVREINSDRRVKVKKDSYLLYHKIIGKISPRTLAKPFLEAEIEEYRATFGENNYVLIDNIVQILEKNYLNLKRRILETYKKYATIESQKDFAITINKNVHRDIVSIMFSIHNGQIDINDFDRSFRQYLLKISESKLIQLLDI